MLLSCHSIRDELRNKGIILSTKSHHYFAQAAIPVCSHSGSTFCSSMLVADMRYLIAIFKHLKSKRNVMYLNTHSVPRSEHFPSLL
jgi:3-deoxy-D-manno-octulosonic acid (KDO) 8-phosphate synthase